MATAQASQPSYPPQSEPDGIQVAASDPLMIRLVSDDPDLAIYWLVDPEETTDATTD